MIPRAWQAACDAARRELKGARWVRPEQRHLTLRFIGELEDAARLRAEVDARARGWERSDVRLDGLGTFGGRRPTVLFAKITPEAPARAIAASLEEACVASGIAPADRPYSPHVTLARLKRVERGPLRALSKESLRTPVAALDRVALVESRLGADGARYVPLVEWVVGQSGS